MLAQAGVRANELVTNIQNFTAQERIKFRILDRVGNQSDAGSDDFDYTAVLVRQSHGYTVQESRTPSPVAVRSRLPRTISACPKLPMFLPEFRDELRNDLLRRRPEERTSYMDDQSPPAQKPPRDDGFITAKDGIVYPAPLKGRAWIAKDSGEVVHLEIVLMHPIAAANIQSWSLSINYAPVHFRTRNIDVWLPQSAEVYRETETGRTFTSHKFTDFRLFSVHANRANSPPSK